MYSPIFDGLFDSIDSIETCWFLKISHYKVSLWLPPICQIYYLEYQIVFIANNETISKNISMGAVPNSKNYLFFALVTNYRKYHRRKEEENKKSRTLLSPYSDRICFPMIRQVKYDGTPLGHHFNNMFIFLSFTPCEFCLRLPQNFI